MDLARKMEAGVLAYIKAFNNGDVDALTALFVPEAEVHDPVGTPPKLGHEGISAYYRSGTENGSKLEISGPFHVAGDSLAVHITVHVNTQSDIYQAQANSLPKGQMLIDLIDVFTFNEQGKIVLMRGYWGPDNIHHNPPQ